MCYVLAKQSKTGHLDETGELDFREAISISEEDATEQYPFYGYAEKFEDENTIMTFNRNHFLANEVTRCTVLFWLEGFDPDNVIQEAPQDGSLKLSVDIKGSEDD